MKQPGDASPKPDMGEVKEAKTEKEPPKDEELKEEDPRTEEARAEPSASSSGPEPSGKPRAFYPPDPSGSGAKRPGSMSSKLLEPGGTAGPDEKSEYPWALPPPIKDPKEGKTEPRWGGGVDSSGHKVRMKLDSDRPTPWPKDIWEMLHKDVKERSAGSGGGP